MQTLTFVVRLPPSFPSRPSLCPSSPCRPVAVQVWESAQPCLPSCLQTPSMGHSHRRSVGAKPGESRTTHLTLEKAGRVPRPSLLPSLGPAGSSSVLPGSCPPCTPRWGDSVCSSNRPGEDRFLHSRRAHAAAGSPRATFVSEEIRPTDSLVPGRRECERVDTHACTHTMHTVCVYKRMPTHNTRTHTPHMTLMLTYTHEQNTQDALVHA